MSADLFPDIVEYRVVEYAPGKFAPVVAEDGEWKFTGGRVYSSPEAAAMGAEDEVAFLRKFWGQKAQDRPSNAAVADGRYYRMGSSTARADLRGCAGRTFHLRNLSTGEVTTCSDLWVGGAIPDFARPAFPDTHEFVGGAP